MKTKAELAALKEEFEALSKKLAELTDEELKQVAGGIGQNDGIVTGTLTRGDKKILFSDKHNTNGTERYNPNIND